MKRIEKIKKRLFEKEFYTKKEWWGEDKTILTNDEIKKEPLPVRKALAMDYMYRNMPIELKDDELVVGICMMNSIGFGRVFVEYALEEEKAAAAKHCFSEKSVWGHHPPNYEKVINIGLDGVKKEIYERVARELEKEEQDEEALILWRSMIIALDGVVAMARRYSDLAFKTALEEKDPVRKKELLEISRICNRVPEYPAETFQEAVQCAWFIFIAHQSAMNSVPVARADQYLYPLYKKDIESGHITKEFAREIIGSYVAKFSERVQMNKDDWEIHLDAMSVLPGGDPDEITGMFNMENDAEYNYGTSANHWLLNMILGGLNSDGSDATNDVTYMILEEWGYLEPVAPVLSVRFHDNTPDRLYRECADILRHGSGEPCIYNDEPIIKGLVRDGVPIEDARCYSNDGCWEALIPGKTQFGYLHIELMQLLEYMFMNGKSLVRKRKEGADIGDVNEIKTYDEFYEKYFTYINSVIDGLIADRIKYADDQYKIAPQPLLSALVDGCIENGRDMSRLGAKYNMLCFVLTGLASFVDSLAVVKKLVFEDKTVTLAELKEAMETNFEGKEPLRMMLKNEVPKFGNDNSYTDDICAKLLADISAIIAEKNKNKVLGEKYILNLAIGTFENYPRFGHNLGASIDGRLYQETLSSNYSPSFGVDKNGPTAAFKSITHADLIPYYVGCPLDIQINPNEVEGEDGLDRMVTMMKAFRELGGIMLTINGVSEEELKDAQVNPMKHQSLRVRLGGLSAYFIALAKEQQDNIIKRTNHSV